MAKIRVIRTLEYIGDAEWIKEVLDKSYIQLDRALNTPRLLITEVKREQNILEMDLDKDSTRYDAYE